MEKSQLHYTAPSVIFGVNKTDGPNPDKIDFAAQIPVVVDQNVLFSVKCGQEKYASHLDGPYPRTYRPSFQ